jgi:16S rRNA (adenine1518-N6/adenine1519-N6)-dimethyltransferase
MLDARSLLKEYQLIPRKSLGQNFLVDPRAPQRIVDFADIVTEDSVIEIGAGLGALTYELAQRCQRVIAVETDPKLVAVLQQEFAENHVIHVVEGDILKLDPASILAIEGSSQGIPLWGPILDNYVVVANLPYYITSVVIRHIFESSVRPRRMVITVQREVALRMVAQPDDMSLMSISTQFYSKPRIVMRLKKGAFYPAPNVESAVVVLDLYKDPPYQVDDIARFFSVIRAGFSQKRKQLRNSLAAGLPLSSQAVENVFSRSKIDHRRRAETLALSDWAKIYNHMDFPTVQDKVIS